MDGEQCLRDRGPQQSEGTGPYAKIVKKAAPLLSVTPRRRRDIGPRNCLAVPSPALSQMRADRRRLQPLQDLRTIVINLDRRLDRFESCSSRLVTGCPGLRFEKFSATDGRRDAIPVSDVVFSWNTAKNVEYQKKRAIRKGWNDLDTYQERDLELSAGERGCASSHIRAWRLCLELAEQHGDKPLLVLEDDAVPTTEFTESLLHALDNLPPSADVLYLGYSQASDWRREVTHGLVEAEYVWTTVGYIIWPQGARKCLSRLPVDGPVDNWMAGLCAEGHIASYCVRPKVILQAEAWNVNSDISHSDEHYWGPDSDIHHSDEFYWGPDEPQAKKLKMASSLLWDVENSDDESIDEDCL